MFPFGLPLEYLCLPQDISNTDALLILMIFIFHVINANYVGHPTTLLYLFFIFKVVFYLKLWSPVVDSSLYPVIQDSHFQGQIYNLIILFLLFGDHYFYHMSLVFMFSFLCKPCRGCLLALADCGESSRPPVGSDGRLFWACGSLEVNFDWFLPFTLVKNVIVVYMHMQLTIYQHYMHSW